MSVRIITKGVRTLLMNRIQCMRDTGELILDEIEKLEDRRAICCGYPIDSSSSSSSSVSSSSGSISSSSGTEDYIDGVLHEDGEHIILDENETTYEVTEAHA